MTFTQEYERMRPLDEDRHEDAAEFTSPHYQLFDSDTYLSEKLLNAVEATHLWTEKEIYQKKLRRSLIRYERRYEVPRKEVVEEKDKPLVGEYDSYVAYLQAHVREAYQREILTCFCGRRADYYCGDIGLCINHVHVWNHPRIYH